MIKLNWQRFGISVLACAMGAWIGGTVTFWLQGILFGPLRADGAVLSDVSFWRYLLASPWIALLAFIPTAILGLPGQYILQRFGITGFIPIVALAAFLGALAFPIVSVTLDTMSDGQSIILGGFAGLFIASIA